MRRQSLRGSSSGLLEAEDEQSPINITSPIKVTLEGTGRILNNTWLHYTLAVKRKPGVERQNICKALIFRNIRCGFYLERGTSKFGVGNTQGAHKCRLSTRHVAQGWDIAFYLSPCLFGLFPLRKGFHFSASSWMDFHCYHGIADL